MLGCRVNAYPAYTPQLTDSLTKQALRLQASFKEEKLARQVATAARKAKAAADMIANPPASISGFKRDADGEMSGEPAKRARMRSPSPTVVPGDASVKAESKGIAEGKAKQDRESMRETALRLGENVDVGKMALEDVAEWIVASLAAYDRDELADAMQVGFEL